MIILPFEVMIKIIAPKGTHILYILIRYLKLIISAYDETETLWNDLTAKMTVNKNHI